MYTAIWRHAGGAMPPDELARASRGLANRLGAADGFVAYVLLATPDGDYASIGIFVDRASLTAAQELVAGALPAARPCPGGMEQIVGEVLAQKGL